jgi:hypothetical protein
MAELLRVLGREVAEVFAGLHRDHGVDLRFGVQVAEITSRGGAATGVRLGDGSHVPADVVIVGVGIAPNIGLASAAGLDISDGIEVDEHLRTSDPTSTRQGMSPARSTRCSASTCGSSTGRTSGTSRAPIRPGNGIRRRASAGRHERQHLGRQRRDPGFCPLREANIGTGTGDTATPLESLA